MNILACPYCNAHVPSAERPTAGQCISCPRCGEFFPYHPAQTVAQVPAQPTAAGPTPANPEISTRRWTIPHAIALALVIGMLVLLALLIGHKRDPQQLPPGTLEDTSDDVALDGLGGLGYLPADTDVVGMVHVAELLANNNGKEFLKSFQFGDNSWGLDAVVRCTGLQLEEIDHLTIGLKVQGQPRLILVAQTIKPYNLARLHQALKIKGKHSSHEKTLYRFTLDKSLPGQKEGSQADLWCPSSRILVAGLPGDDLDGVAGETHLIMESMGAQADASGGVPVGSFLHAAAAAVAVKLDACTLDAVPNSRIMGVDRFSPALQALLKDPRCATAQLCMIGHAEGWAKLTPELLAWAYLGRDREIIKSVRTFGIWLWLDKPIAIDATALCTDEKSARTLYDYLIHQHKLSDQVVHVEKNQVNVQNSKR